jgi:uncharacterized protein YkwD
MRRMCRYCLRLLIAIGLLATVRTEIAVAQKLQVVVQPRPAGDKTDPRLADVGQVTKLLVELTNEFRRQENLPPLAVNRELDKAAQGFADFMAGSDKYGHTADDREPAERIAAAGYDYCLIQENIAYLSSTAGFDTRELADRLFAGWKKSPDHRRHLLEPLTSEIGVAVAYSTKSTRYYGVQEFGRPKSAQIVVELSNPTTRAVTYRIDDMEFTLEPRFTRRHKRCTPPSLEITGYEASDGKPIVMHPATGDRYVVVSDADGRLRIEKGKLEIDEPKPASLEKPASPEIEAAR